MYFIFFPISTFRCIQFPQIRSCFELRCVTLIGIHFPVISDLHLRGRECKALRRRLMFERESDFCKQRNNTALDRWLRGRQNMLTFELCNKLTFTFKSCWHFENIKTNTSNLTLLVFRKKHLQEHMGWMGPYGKDWWLFTEAPFVPICFQNFLGLKKYFNTLATIEIR